MGVGAGGKRADIAAIGFGFEFVQVGVLDFASAEIGVNIFGKMSD